MAEVDVLEIVIVPTENPPNVVSEHVEDSACSSSSDEREPEEAHEEQEAPPKKKEDTLVSVKMEDLHPTWVASIKEKHRIQPKILRASGTSSTICRVPRFLRQHDLKAYTPQIISIGPLHYDKREAELKLMEEHKWRYLHDILGRKEEGFLERCLAKVKELEEAARDCYSEVINLDSNSFVEMMVLDGCFIIELFRKKWFKECKDAVFKLPWLAREIMVDLVMLENQIPFFILENLFDLMDISCPSLRKAALGFFKSWPTYHNILSEIAAIHDSNLNIHHLLHLLHESMVHSTEKEYPPSKATESVPSASILQESGIKFKRRDDINCNGNFLDIKFEKGVIEIPQIRLSHKTNTIVRNLIALEQFCLHRQQYITAYMFFMDSLINGEKDVEILREKGILKKSLGSEANVVALFSNTTVEVILFPNCFYLESACQKINEYRSTTWPKLRAVLVHDYFRNPWAIVSFLGALVLLLLTTTQTFFSSFPKFAFGK